MRLSPILDRAISPNDGTSKRLGNAGQDRNRKEMPAPRNQHAVNLLESGFQVRYVLECFRGQHQVEAGVGISQASQILGTNALDGYAGIRPLGNNPS